MKKLIIKEVKANMKFLLIFLCSLLFCFNVQAGNYNFSGFKLFGSPNNNNLAPISEKYKGITPEITLNNGSDLTIIIYSHGTTRPQKKEDCTKSWNQIPRSLKVMKNDENTYFYYLCSKARDGSEIGSFIYERKQEINKILNQLIAADVKPENIFLAGHSAGGWASLMMMDQVEKKFNSAVVFAPAFAGPRSEINQYPKWRKEARPKQIREMTRVKAIKALVFAYEDDEFNRPKELNFLINKYPNTVELVGYKCNEGHMTSHFDCKINKTKKKIQDYLENSKY